MLQATACKVRYAGASRDYLAACRGGATGKRLHRAVDDQVLACVAALSDSSAYVLTLSFVGTCVKG
jgi:hypothetical protein